MFTLERHILSFDATWFASGSTCATQSREAQRSPRRRPSHPSSESGARMNCRARARFQPLSLFLSFAHRLLSAMHALAQNSTASLSG